MNRMGEYLAMAGLAVLAAVCLYAMAAGDVWTEGGRILDMPWGVALFVDIYLGFLLFSGWVVFRESSRAAAAIWVGFILVGGNLVTCVYVLRAFRQARGDWGRFWMGTTSDGGPDPSTENGTVD